jgi:hypothetical protein
MLKHDNFSSKKNLFLKKMAIREAAKTHTHTQSFWEKNRQLARFNPTIKNKNKNKIMQ